ncbi:Gfo/Idh/MocA family protein [Salinifilum ghardaiensis]
MTGTRPRALLVGFAGKQGREFLDPMTRHADVVGGVDPHPDAPVIAERAGFPVLDGIARAIRDVPFDVALVTIPHSEHISACRTLLEAGKHVLKEKPFAAEIDEADDLVQLAGARDVSVYTLVQRRFHPAFTFAREYIARIGAPYWFSYEYHANHAGETTGWRGVTDTARGGVLLDMGYHALDVLTELLPKPATVRSTFLHCHETMRRRRLEDFAAVSLGYEPPTLAGTLNVSRHHHAKTERLTVLGSAGSLEVTPAAAMLFSSGGKPVADIQVTEPKTAIQDRMVASYLRDLDEPRSRAAHLRQQKSVVTLLRRAYGAEHDVLAHRTGPLADGPTLEEGTRR